MKFFRRNLRSYTASVLFYAFILGATQFAYSQYVCQPNGAPEVRTGSIAAGDSTQTSRINRDGVPSSCTGGAPTAAPIAGSFRFDSYNFTNPTGQDACVTVDYNMTGCGGTANNSTQVNAYSSFDPANANTNVIGKPGFSTVATGSLQFRVTAGQSFVVTVHETVAGGGCTSYTFTLTYRTSCREAGYDRTNDGKADLTYFRPSNGTWNIFNSAGGTNTLMFGQSGDIPTAGDYTGDGQTDVSTYRSSANTWFYSTSQTTPQSNVTYQPFGTSGDVPVPGDYDKDGKTDIALWRPSNGVWYILRSSNATLQYQNWGATGDTPVTGDYDGDLTNDFGVVRTVGGQYRWYILGTNFGNGFVYGCGTTVPICGSFINFGGTGDKIVSGDFDGDARTDIAVFRPSDGSWLYLRSSLTAANVPGANSASWFTWGLAGDVPQPADYDGDKRTDFAVFRPSTGTWYVSNSNNGTYNTYVEQVWGTATDQPVSSPFLTP